MADDSAELIELRKQTQMLANWEVSKAIFGGLVLGIGGGLVLAVATVDSVFSPITMWAPVVLPVLLVILFWVNTVKEYGPSKPKAQAPRPAPKLLYGHHIEEWVGCFAGIIAVGAVIAWLVYSALR